MENQETQKKSKTLPFNFKLGSWDAGLTYDYLFSRLLNLYNQFLTLFNSLGERRYAYQLVLSAIGLIQLRNGLRESEAVESFLHFVQTGDRKFRIQAKKHNNERWVIIPPYLIRGDLKEAYAQAYNFELDPKKLKERYRKWLKKKLEVNTHTLRYAFIKKMMEKGVTSDKIAIILGHKKVETTFKYQQKFDSLRLLEENLE